MQVQGRPEADCPPLPLTDAGEHRRGPAGGAGGLELSTCWVPLSGPLLQGHPRAERPCVTGRKRKASRQINRLRVLKDFSFFPFVYLNFISHSIWVTCAYNRGLYKRRKVWTPSLQGIESYCFTATFVGQQGTKIPWRCFCRAPWICCGPHCVPRKLTC